MLHCKNLGGFMRLRRQTLHSPKVFGSPEALLPKVAAEKIVRKGKKGQKRFGSPEALLPKLAAEKIVRKGKKGQAGS